MLNINNTMYLLDAHTHEKKFITKLKNDFNFFK